MNNKEFAKGWRRPEELPWQAGAVSVNVTIKLTDSVEVVSSEEIYERQPESTPPRFVRWVWKVESP